jgi:hypothetical protein
MSATNPPSRIDNAVKQILFVVGVALGLLHLFAVAVLLFGGGTGALGAVAFLDVTAVIFAGLVWLSQRIFPTEGEGR